MKIILSVAGRLLSPARMAGAVAAWAALACFSSAQAPVYQWTTFAGQPGAEGSADGVGPAASFFGPSATAVDAAGNVFVADTNNHLIRKVTSAGVVTTLAGRPGSPGSDNGTGSAARFSRPTGVAVDASGNVYVADTGNSSIRKVTSAGVVTTLAGSGVPGDADGTGAAARFRSPVALARDAAGNLYVVDTAADTLRKVTPAGAVTTLAGKPDARGENGVFLVDGAGAAARFFAPTGVALDASGVIYVADSFNAALRKVTAGGAVTTLVSNPSQGAQPLPFSVRSVAVDKNGQIYIGDTFSIRKVSSTGAVTFLAGSGKPSSNDGAGSTAGIYEADGLAVDAGGTLYVADYLNDSIRKVTSTGVVTTLAGSARAYGSTDATGRAARFWNPSGVAVDASGTVYVSDGRNQTIRKITAAGAVTTLAGSVGQGAFLDGAGAAARFLDPFGVTVDPSGTIYVADTDNAAIRKVTREGVVTTLAGAPTPDNGDGFAASAAVAPAAPGGVGSFSFPRGVAADASGNVYVADESGPIYKVTSAGVVSTLTTVFARPFGLALDAGGNLFVPDSSNHTISKVTPGGVVTLVAGSPGEAGSSDGAGTAARFNFPLAAAFDPAGNLLILDAGNSTIRKMTPAGVVSTIAGVAGMTGTAEGAGAAARFSGLNGLAVGRDGTVYVADSGNNRIVRGFVLSAPAAPVYGRNPAIYVVDRYQANIVPNLPIPVSPQAAPTSYSITPTGLPRGLFFDPATGAITGAVSGDSNTQTYTVTARNAAGSSSGTPLVLGAEGQSSGWSWSNFAGQAQTVGGADGTAGAARFNVPVSSAVDLQGNVYVTDFAGHTIRKITPDGVVSTLAGQSGVYGSADGTGSAARFNNPAGIAVDRRGNLYVGDALNSTIRKISPAGVVTTFAGRAGSVGSADGTGSAARFNTPKGVAVDAAGNLYIGDLLNHTIRKISPAGVVSTLAGSPGSAGLANGTGSAARFNGPTGVAVDASGDLYVADARNSLIRKVTAAGVVTTVGGRNDGTGQPAKFDRPQGVAVDASGNLFVTNTSASAILEITRSSRVIQIGGDSAGQAGYNNGPGNVARFSQPFGIAVSSTNRVFVADTFNQRIAKGANDSTMIGFGYGTSLFTFQAGQPIRTLQPTGVDDLPTHFSVSPAFPPGLYLDPATGVISGTPTTSMASVHYLITATNSGGTLQTGVTISVGAGSAALAGNYSLLLGNPGGPRAAISVTLAPGLSATGTVVRENGTRLVVQTGVLAANRSTTVVLSDGSTLSLAFDGNGRVSATLIAGSVTLSGQGSIGPYVVPASLPGTYTVAFDTGDGGFGYALLTLTTQRGIFVAGRLPDGTAFLGNQDLLLDRDGNISVFFLGDGSPRSLLAGALHFADGVVSDDGVTLNFTTGGVTKACDAVGAMYTPTSSGLVPGNYPLTLDGAGIQLSSTVGFDSFNHVAVAPPILGLQSSVSSGLANGVFSLQFRALGTNGQPTGPTLTGSGIYSQRLGRGFGQFTKDGQAGSVVIGPISP